MNRGLVSGIVTGWLAVAITVAAGVFGARADDDRVEEPNADGVASRQDGNAVDLQANFDANLFEQTGGGWVLRRNGVRIGRPSPTGAVRDDGDSLALARLRRLGEQRLDRLDRACGLTARQQEQLALAVESDARRLAGEIDATRSRYAGVVADFSHPEGQRKWQQFQQDVQRCRAALQGAFDTGSLFAAVLTTTLDAPQRSKFDAELRARRSFRWRAMLAPVLLKMDESLGLTQEQHDAIERLLIAAEPPLTLDPLPGRRNAHAEQMLIYLQLSRVDAQAIRQVLSERQWRTVSLLMNQGKAMKSWLDQQGLVEPQR